MDIALNELQIMKTKWEKCVQTDYEYVGCIVDSASWRVITIHQQ